MVTRPVHAICDPARLCKTAIGGTGENSITGFVRVLESPGILLWHFPGLESPGKRPLVLESSGNLLNSAKKYEVYGRQ